jgi:hypothetical protein
MMTFQLHRFQTQCHATCSMLTWSLLFLKLSKIKLGEREYLLRSGGTASDSFVGFDRIFERYRVYSWQL